MGAQSGQLHYFVHVRSAIGHRAAAILVYDPHDWLCRPFVIISGLRIGGLPNFITCVVVSTAAVLFEEEDFRSADRFALAMPFVHSAA